MLRCEKQEEEVGDGALTQSLAHAYMYLQA
jgi:hypothetical protein